MAARALDCYQRMVKEIKAGKIASAYLLSGEEQVLAEYVITVLQEQLIPGGMESLNYQRLDGQKATDQELVAAIATPPMFGAKRLVVIDQPWFLAGKKEGQLAGLERMLDDLPEFTCVVFLAAQVDKRLKLVKRLKDNTHEFPPLSAGEAAAWADDRLRRAGVGGFGLGKRIVERAGSSLRVLRLEIDKLVAYADGSPLQAEDIVALVRNDMETSVFDLVDAVGQRQLEQALHLADQLQTEGQAPLYILSMISRQLRLLLLARMQLDSGASEQQAAGALGIHPYPAGKCVLQARLWTERSLQQAIKHCLEAEELTKTGQLSDQRALDQLFLNLI